MKRKTPRQPQPFAKLPFLHFCSGLSAWPLASTALMGFLSGFAFVPWQQFWLFPLLVFLFIKKITDDGFMRRSDAKTISLHGFLFYFFQNLLSLSWVGSAPMVFDPSLWWVGWLMAILLPALVASFYGAIFFIVKKYGTTAPQQILILLVGLPLVDIGRQWLLSGLPWNIASHSFLYLPIMMPLVSLVGQYVMSFWLYGIIFLCLLCWHWRLKNNSKLHGLLLGVAILIWTPLLFGYFMQQKTSVVTPTNHDNFRILLVQPNFSVAEYHNHQTLIKNIESLKKMSRDKLDKTPRLIIWPESAIPINIADATVAAFITNFMNADDRLVLGTLHRDGTDIYNSMMMLDAGGKMLAVYNKHHLVPFGEYLPFGAVAKKFGLVPVAAQNIDLAVGQKPTAIAINDDNGFSFLPLICFEVAFPNMVQRPIGNGAATGDAIINITNDAWFGAGIGPRQHLFMAQLRAAENGLPLYRAAMTGITAVIDHRGQVVEQIAFGHQGSVVSYSLPKKQTTPFYAKHRHFIDGGLLLLLSLAMVGLCFIRKKYYKKNIIKKS